MAILAHCVDSDDAIVPSSIQQASDRATCCGAVNTLGNKFAEFFTTEAQRTFLIERTAL
jgi:hypothetical protein